MNSAFLKFIIFFISNILKLNRGIVYIKDQFNYTVDFIEFSCYNSLILPITGINAYLIESLINDGCNHIENRSNNANNSYKWYILLNDDKCSISRKIINAVKANYYGILLYPSNNSDQCCFNRDDQYVNNIDDNVRQKRMDIPVLKISKSDAETLALKYMLNDHIFIQPKLDPRITFGLLIVIMVILILILIMVWFIIAIMFYLKKPTSYENLDQTDSLLEDGISRSALSLNNNTDDEELPTSYLHSIICAVAPIIKVPRSQTMCVICREDFQQKEKIRAIRHCKHAFHSLCLENWWADDLRPCPVCRFTVDLTNLNL